MVSNPSERSAWNPSLHRLVSPCTKCSRTAGRGKTGFAHGHSLKYEWVLKLDLKPCLRRNLYVQAWIFTHVVDGGLSVVLGVGLDACSAFISAAPQVSLLSWHSGGRCGMTKNRGQAFLLHLNHISVLSTWTAIRLHKSGYALCSCTPVSSDLKPCLCHFVGWERQCYLCKPSMLLPLTRTSSLQATIWWVCSIHRPSSSPLLDTMHFYTSCWP